MWKCVMITQGNCSTVKCWLTNEKMYLMNIKINTDVDIIFWYHICQTTTMDAIDGTSTDPWEFGHINRVTYCKWLVSLSGIMTVTFQLPFKTTG